MNSKQRPATPPPCLFAFEDCDEELSLLPLCSRRALDHAGLKLNLASYQKLSVEQRFELASLGSNDQVAVERVKILAQLADPQVPSMDVVTDPDKQNVPLILNAGLGTNRALSEKIWADLTDLERYSLHKVALKNRGNRLNRCYDELIGARQVSTHLKPEGGVVMVSIANKEETQRVARAESWIKMSATAYGRLTERQVPKGDVLATARLAGIMATKRTADLIPLCHPLALQHADLSFEMHANENQIRIECTVCVFGRTGVEMEAMVGASVAALTIYDMMKSLDQGLTIGPTQLLEKRGGRRGHYRAHNEPGAADNSVSVAALDSQEDA